jgi:hypothetical protein
MLILGSSGIGLEWGWSMGRVLDGCTAPLGTGLGLGAATVGIAAQALLIGGPRAATSLLLSGLLASLAHAGWRRELKLRGGSERR